MAIIMGKGCLEAIYGLMGWKGLRGVKAIQNCYSLTQNTALVKTVLLKNNFF